MSRFLDALKRMFRREPRDGHRGHRVPRPRDPPFVGGASVKEIEQAPSGRAQELAGHAVERVDT